MTAAIVVVAFNRPASLKRLLYAISVSNYGDLIDIPLVISIDYQDSDENIEVGEIADSFDWRYGKKIVNKEKSNLGLRQHILKCGSLTEIYGDVVVIEDDLYVSPNFYTYCIKMLDRYGNDDNVAGISLYKHLWNVNAVRPFYPQDDSNDIFFMQFAQSWGQCWNWRMWNDFYLWYKCNSEIDFKTNVDIPPFVRSWSEKSWLKYFIAYLVYSQKYFVYPYLSLSTNCGDAGTHVVSANTISNVPLVLADKEYNKLPEVYDGVRYDVFFERQGLEDHFGFSNTELCVDLYGLKTLNAEKRYWLTSKAAPYKILRAYSLNFRPIELNVLLNCEGADLFLYDTHSTNHLSPKKNEVNEILYDLRNITFKSLLILLAYRLKTKIQSLK